MKSHFRILLAVLAGTAVAGAQSPWRFSFGPSTMVGLRTEFSGFGNYAAPALPALGTNSNFIYLDGAVQVDSTGNAGGFSSFFSYQNNAQIVPGAFGANDGLRFNSITSLGGAGSVEESSVAAAGGFDLSAHLRLGGVSIPAGGGRTSSWGLRMGLQYNRVDTTNRDTIAQSVTTISDLYDAGPGPLPSAPYQGPFVAGPGVPLIDVSSGGSPPVRTFGTGTAVISGNRKLDVHIAATQFGTYLEIPVAKKLDVMVEGGVILALASGSYRYDTTVAVANGANQVSSGYERRTRFLPGFYTGIGLTYHLTDNVGILGSVRYQFMKEFDITANGSTAAVSFNNAFALSLSVLYTF